jgi:hypothetical protein
MRIKNNKNGVRPRATGLPGRIPGISGQGRFFLSAFLFTALLSPGIFAQDGGGRPVPGEEWYASNAGGMALQPMPSRLAALRGKYSLMVGRAAFGDLPALLREYYQDPWSIEVRVLYADGAESRRQWIFTDREKVIRLVSVFVEAPPPEDEDTEDEDAPEEVPPDDDQVDRIAPEGEEKGEAEAGAAVPGFIELYNGEGLLTGERRFQDGGEEVEIRYFYNQRFLLRAETTRKFSAPPEPAAEPEESSELPLAESSEPLEFAESVEPLESPESVELEEAAELPPVEPEEPLPAERLVCTDYYRYSRSGSLRTIERVYHEPAEGVAARIRFPHRILDSIHEKEFVNPALTYGSESLSDILIDSPYRVVYNTDQRGRILSETRLDKDGQVVGELNNTWLGDRLSRIVWKAGEDERRIEYRYNADGDRIEERNFRNGNLERVVMKEGDIEVEELYINDQPVLRVRWEKGRKISEERIRPSGSGRAR